MNENNAIVPADDDNYVAEFPPNTSIAPANNRLAPGEIPSGSSGMLQSANNSQTASMIAGAMAQTELQMKMAMMFPRQIDQATVAIARACQNPEFAEVALYSFQKGEKTISGPSIKMAEELSRHWGNINSGYFIVMDDESQRTVRAWSWDMQTNVRKEQDVTFAKLIERWVRGQKVWVVPNERDLQQLTSAKAQIGVRNMLLAQIPDQLKRDAVSWCRQTLRKKDAQDPDAFKKKMMLGFARLGVSPDAVRDLVGKELGSIRAPADDKIIEYLRGVYNRLDRGDSTFSEIIAERAIEMGIDGRVPTTAAELRQLVSEKAQTSSEPTRRASKKGD